MKPEKTNYSHSLTMRNTTAAFLVAGATYGYYSNQADEAADKLAACLTKESYNAFAITDLLNRTVRYGASSSQTTSQIRGADLDLMNAATQAVYRALTRAGGLEAIRALIGPQERAHSQFQTIAPYVEAT